MCLIVLPTLVIYVVVLGMAANQVYVLSRQEVQDDMARLATNYAARFDGYLREAAMIAEVTAGFMCSHPRQTESQVFQQLRSNVELMPLVYGACMAFEPGAFKQDDSLFAPYVYRSEAGLTQMNISRDVYDWYADPAYTWYQEPKAANRAVWSKPYFDEGAGNVLMCTYSAPFYSGDEFRGVTTVDINLPQIQATVGKAIVKDLNFVILTSEGEFVYAPDASRIMHTTLFDAAREAGRPDLAALGVRMLKGEPGVASIDGWDSPDRQWVFYAPIESTGWVFACRVPERTVLSDVWRRMTVGGVALGAALVLIVACIFFVSRLISRPIARLNAKALEIAAGNLDARVEGVSGKDEIGQLGQSFNQMTSDLRKHVERLAHEKAALEKIEKELDIARDIQRNLLPTRDPGLADFDIAGWSQAAEKTGGDYYDWQTLADGRIAISLADATGHGIGPAIVATVCRAYQRASFLNRGALTTLLGNINDLLVEDMSDGRFVTFVVGVLTPSTHCVEVLSAGHGPILAYSAANDGVREIEPQGLPLGIMSGADYDEPTDVELLPGDFLLLTTDGFFEWANPQGELFGLERLVESALRAKSLTSAEIIKSIYTDVIEFSQGTSQDDDVTAVVVKRRVAIAAE